VGAVSVMSPDTRCSVGRWAQPADGPPAGSGCGDALLARQGHNVRHHRTTPHRPLVILLLIRPISST
jgi:hypothetical protein